LYLGNPIKEMESFWFYVKRKRRKIMVYPKKDLLLFERIGVSV